MPTGNIFKGTVVRAIATSPRHLASSVATASFFISPEGGERFSLPVLSITIDEKHLFGYETGLFTPGTIYDQWRMDNPDSLKRWWVRPANYRQRGNDWERTAHMEFFESNSELGFAANVGVRIHGGASRALAARKSLRFYARNARRDSFHYDLFPTLTAHDGSNRPIESFRRFIFRNSGNDFGGTLFRDALLHSLVSHWPIETQAYRPAIHFINGEYWGINNLRERIDRFYLASHYDIDPDLTVILTGNATVDTGFLADQNQFVEISNFAMNQDLEEDVNYQWVVERVDTENLLLYFAFQIYVGNTDWPHNNIDFWRKRLDSYDPQIGRGRDGRWRWILYDVDFGFDRFRITHDTFTHALEGDTLHVRNLMNGLLENKGFRHGFINAFCDLMNSSMRPEHVHAKVDYFNAGIAHSRAEHVQRWRSGSDTGGLMKNFASERPAVIRQLIQDRYIAGDLKEVTLSADASTGIIRVNFTEINGNTPGVADPTTPYPWTGLYFENIPIKLEALPKQGHQFVGWKLNGDGEMFSSEPVIELALIEDTAVEAVFEPIPLAQQPVGLHVWDFEDAGNLLAPSYTLGGGELVFVPGTDPESRAEADTGGDFDTQHLRIYEPLGSSLTFSLPTVGYEDITLDFLTRRSGQGAGLQTIAYSVDNELWTDLATYEVYDAPPQVLSFDFSAVDGVADNPDFAVRITFAQGAGGISGNNRFDDVSLSGVALPGVNLPPVVMQELVLKSLIENGVPLEIDLETIFTDPNGDALVFGADSDAPDKVSVSLVDSSLTLTPNERGEAGITLSAADGHYASVETSFRVLVYPASHLLADAPFSFGEWDPDEPDGVYPANMLFVQGEQNDSGLTTSLLHAYSLRPEDYHANDQGTIGFPYNNTGRTRINGLGEDGIAFINTGQGRDLGGAIVAVDTRGLTNAWVRWLGGTVLPNSRIYAIRLQYRVGVDGEFVDLLDEHDQPVEYIRNSNAGHTQSFGPVALPETALDQEYVQLLWRYYRVSGTSGPRAQLRLDEILIHDDSVTANTGTPLWWLASHGLTNGSYEAAALSIPDGGTLPAWKAYVADLDPMDLQAGLPRLNVEMSDGEWVVELEPLSTNRWYTIKKTQQLDPPDWQPVSSGHGESAFADVDFELPTNGPLFLRVLITVP